MLTPQHFTTLINEVEQLKHTYDTLNKELPRLITIKSQLKAEIDKANRKLVKVQLAADTSSEQLAKQKATTLEEIAKAKDELQKAKETFAKQSGDTQGELDKLAATNAEEAAKLAQINSNVEKRMAELLTFKQELTEKERLTNEAQDLLQKQQAEMTAKRLELDKIKENLIVDRQQLDEKTVEINEQLAQAQETKRLADARLDKASRLLSETKEKQTILTLKDDEISRRESQLAGREAKLKKEEAALKDKLAVYESHFR